MAFETWDEIRTAYQVARLGTVSAAAQVLGVHHATVIRHIDALEARLGAKLFQRHARGYAMTEAGQDLLSVAEGAEARFAQLAARIGGASGEVAGDVIVTAIPGLAPLVVPALARLARAHPAVRLRYLTDLRLFRLEVGEAHVAIRVGSRPTEPDNVVQPLCQLATALYASPAYLEAAGPVTEADLAAQSFVCPSGDAERAPAHRWLMERVGAERIAFRSNEVASVEAAIAEGLGLGFVAVMRAAEQDNLVQVMPPRADWAAPCWLVSHVDLHRTARVQAVLAALKEQVREMPTCEGA